MKFAASTFAAAVFFGLGLAIGAGATGSHYRAKIASMKTEQAQREAAAVARALATQQARQSKRNAFTPSLCQTDFANQPSQRAMSFGSLFMLPPFV